MSITAGFAKARRRVRRREPSTQAVWDVKVGKERELSIVVISSRSRGGMGIVGSEAMVANDSGCVEG